MNSQEWTTLASRVDRSLAQAGRSALPSARSFVAATRRASEQSVTEYHVGQAIGILVAAAQQHRLTAAELSASKQHLLHARNQFMYWLRSLADSLRHQSGLAVQRGERQQASSQRRLAAQLEIFAEDVAACLPVPGSRRKAATARTASPTRAASRRKRSG